MRLVVQYGGGSVLRIVEDSDLTLPKLSTKEQQELLHQIKHRVGGFSSALPRHILCDPASNSMWITVENSDKIGDGWLNEATSVIRSYLSRRTPLRRLGRAMRSVCGSTPR